MVVKPADGGHSDDAITLFEVVTREGSLIEQFPRLRAMKTLDAIIDA